MRPHPGAQDSAAMSSTWIGSHPTVVQLSAAPIVHRVEPLVVTDTPSDGAGGCNAPLPSVGLSVLAVAEPLVQGITATSFLTP